jgi:F-type H+-transporting ATPase subunit delta
VRVSTVARNYAQALFEAADRADSADGYGVVLEALAGAVQSDERVRLALESPRVPKTVKLTVLRKALTGRAPEPFMRFIEAVVKRGRQVLLPVISQEYQGLLDVKLNRVHAGVTVARAPSARFQDQIRRRLAEILNQDVVPHFREDPGLIGGVVIRVGDRVMDGSVRRQLAVLRRKMAGG